MKNIAILAFAIQIILLFSCSENKRITITLDGTWEIEEGTMDNAPSSFGHTVQVPGLVSLSVPQFRDAGPRVKERGSLIQKDTLREAFWYHRKFKIGRDIPAVARLKVSRAMFGTKVLVNGKDVGEHLPCFTPGWFNVGTVLRKGENEILIRVGSSRSSIPESLPDGFDFEKERYIPGIFDDVELYMSETPSIDGIQAAPDIQKKSVKIQVRLGKVEETGKIKMNFIVRENRSGKIAGKSLKEFSIPGGQASGSIVTATIPLNNCMLWSPEDPFLYKVTVSTGGDEEETRFGMREFRLDTLTGRTMLNGKPYFMRGSNVTIYRFFEDDSCGDLPWDSGWVRKLHRGFKDFHWNSLRYCIGLPPGNWYDIADEEGIMIQDEFPVWYGGKGWNSWPAELRSAELAKEYREWIQDHWNHPSVVIWDASNETLSDDGRTEEVADAIKQVRTMDLSRRPWDNSYSPVRTTGDVIELHPYHFQDPKFRLSDIRTSSTNPGGEAGEKKYIKIVNEYGWLWLNRDGTPTTLTKELYLNLLGADSSIARRRQVYAMYLAAETEYWRCHREANAVLHFTALGYSRSDGQTSDHFADVRNLVYDKEFLNYIPDAFSPVGIMLDEWGDALKSGEIHQFKMLAINDLEDDWNGKIVLRLFNDGKIVAEDSARIIITGYGQSSLSMNLKVPEMIGRYTLVAALERSADKPIRSVREIQAR